MEGEGEGKRERRTRTKGEKTARSRLQRVPRPAAVAKPVLRLHSLFIRRAAARRGGSNERSLLGRAPTDEKEREGEKGLAPPGGKRGKGTTGICILYA